MAQQDNTSQSQIPSEFYILLCLIQIWEEDPNDIMKQPDQVFMLTEVSDIEISESYKKLINSAVIRFPRGSVLRDTITSVNLNDATSSVSADNTDTGDLIVARSSARLSQPTDFKVGNRISIKLGYTDDPKIAALTKPNQYGKSIFNDTELRAQYTKHLTNMFDGYISQCSIEAPIEIKCEGLASKLRKKTCPYVPSGKNITVNDVLSNNGKYKLLQGTGLELHPDSEKISIDLGKIGFSDDLTVADVLTTWAKFGIYAFETKLNDKPYIRVGRSYFSNPGKDSIFQPGDGGSVTINFDYHVAKNNLKFESTDKKFLAVEAQAVDNKGKFYRITVRENPEYPAKSSDRWQFINESGLTKKAMKSKRSQTTKVNLDRYTIIPYMSKKIGATIDELKEEAKKYYESYNMNGIEGSVEIFGDLKIRTANKVLLIDNQFPQKNGYYFVDEVVTKFGTSGFRQTLKLPYLIAKSKQNNETQ